MFDANDCDSLYSRESRMPSMVMENGQSMQDFYAQLAAQNNGRPARPRRNSASSVMSDTERLYGWSGSKGGVSNETSAPKYRISSSGKLMLAQEDTQTAPTQSSASTTGPGSGRSQITSKRSDGASAKPTYRPAFAPSADLPSSEDENEEDLDRPIQHDLPTTRPLKARTSLKQKLGSLVARVGSARKGSSPPPANSAFPSTSDNAGIKRGATVSGTLGVPRPAYTRKGSSQISDAPIKEEDTDHVRDVEMPVVSITPVVDENNENENIYRDSEGGLYQGGMAGLARKLSRRATTGGASARARGLREEREKTTNTLEDRKAAEEMLKDLAKIPLHPPPASAHIPKPRPLSSFPPRAPLRTSGDNSLSNSPRYSYYQRPLNTADGPRVRDNGPIAAEARSKQSRLRSGSTPSVTSTTGLVSGEQKNVPPVPRIPDILTTSPTVQGQHKWTQFTNSDSVQSLEK